MKTKEIEQELFEFSRNALSTLSTIDLVKHCNKVYADEESQCGKCKYYIKGCIIQRIQRDLQDLIDQTIDNHVVCFQNNNGFGLYEAFISLPIYGPATREECETITSNLKNVIVAKKKVR
jgi:hypothetical protein